MNIDTSDIAQLIYNNLTEIEKGSIEFINPIGESKGNEINGQNIYSDKNKDGSVTVYGEFSCNAQKGNFQITLHTGSFNLKYNEETNNIDDNCFSCSIQPKF